MYTHSIHDYCGPTYTNLEGVLRIQRDTCYSIVVLRQSVNKTSSFHTVHPDVHPTDDTDISVRKNTNKCRMLYT